MINRKITILSVILLVFLIPVAYGDYLNLENSTLTGETSKFDAELFLQFGENHEQKLYSKTKITPILEEGTITVFDKTYTLDNTHVKILGQSFRVIAFEDSYNILIYGENVGNENFEVRVYIYEIDTDRAKFTFDAKLSRQ